MRASLLALMLALASPASAEPTAPVRRLMDEPVSLFDWGIYSLNKALSDSMAEALGATNVLEPDHSKHALLNVSYDVDSNRIQVFISDSDNATTAVGAEESCKWFFEKIRLALAIDPKTGERQDPNLSTIGRYFDHPGGYGSTSKNRDFLALSNHLEDITFIRTSCKSFQEKTFVECRAPLLTNKVYCSQEKYVVDKPHQTGPKRPN